MHKLPHFRETVLEGFLHTSQRLLMGQQNWVAITQSNNLAKKCLRGPCFLLWLASHTFYVLPMITSQMNHLPSKSCLRLYLGETHTKTMLAELSTAVAFQEAGAGEGTTRHICVLFCVCALISDSLRPVDCSPSGSSVHGIFSRQDYLTGLLFPHPGDLPNPGIEPASPLSPALQVDSLPLSHKGNHGSCWGEGKVFGLLRTVSKLVWKIWIICYNVGSKSLFLENLIPRKKPRNLNS